MRVPRLRINLLAILGAFVGVVALFTPWSQIQSVFGKVSFEPSSLQLLSPIDSPFDSRLTTSFFLFLVGTLTVFISPLGGLLQMSGVILFWYDLSNRLQSWPANFEDRLVAGIGSFIGLAASAISLASMVLPAVAGVAQKQRSIKERLLTFSVWLSRRMQLAAVFLVITAVLSISTVVAFTQPVCRLDVVIVNERDFASHFFVYLDDVHIHTGFVGVEGTWSMSFALTVGAHVVGLSYSNLSTYDLDTTIDAAFSFRASIMSPSTETFVLAPP